MSSQAEVSARSRLLQAAWTTNPTLGVSLIAASAVTAIAVGAAGPSSVALDLGDRTDLLPPWYLPAGLGTPSEWVVVPLLWVGLFVGATGLWIAWRAVREGWRPRNRRLFWLGFGLSAATALVLPLTSADVLMYAAYGRLQVLGLDPYDITPADIFRQEYDPVLTLTERPWQDTPSVYGPLASGSQWLAATLGGDSMHHVVFWLQMFSVIPFLVIGALVYRMARDDQATQTRAVLFTLLNPILIWSVVAGAHNEAFTLVFAIVALWFYRRSPLLAGIGIGLAGTIKVSLVFYGLAMLWGYRRDWRKALQLCLGAVIPLVVAYGIVMPKSLFAASRNVGYVSAGSWAPWLDTPLTWLLGLSTARSIVSALGWIAMVAIGWMLSRVLPWKLVPGQVSITDPRREPLTIAVRTAVVLTAAWLLSSPYTLSWYDLIAWVPLGLMTVSRLEPLLMLRGAFLSAAYVTGRAVQFSDGVQAVAVVIRDVGSSAVGWFVIGSIVAWWWREGHQLPSFTRVRASMALARDHRRLPYD
ncbi:MAG: polyprenol phosphomannose-dependent alpha 1,6 mannosyltransferase MptB [Propionicimonas sp.]|uniref:polyprenol phosphomannose-dependent alpha 1,6 mannosyltransferase MptB n=1 Tax=Propionicimonas sp. TaxID=1955623 RepID=UPI002B21B028|nr:polyprenol phosphomannose-dependent alpha 1,6 mannosyltransferase MptB [Propionicimonas sp.]MEA4945214.1 polyprenol phosphomannose-dependent alpha 1,6 mannosyltransferase MptB [Propionicimonas sp.]MEA5117782.1 polyprenol phosphomannose-dependent alpha 1,6 mannosyltransferase MptB [Propionicimonas sp.]